MENRNLWYHCTLHVLDCFRNTHTHARAHPCGLNHNQTSTFKPWGGEGEWGPAKMSPCPKNVPSLFIEWGHTHTHKCGKSAFSIQLLVVEIKSGTLKKRQRLSTIHHVVNTSKDWMGNLHATVVDDIFKIWLKNKQFKRKPFIYLGIIWFMYWSSRCNM